MLKLRIRVQLRRRQHPVRGNSGLLELRLDAGGFALARPLAKLPVHPSPIVSTCAHLRVADRLAERVELCVTRHGDRHPAIFAESEDWAWDKTMDVNLRAPYLLSRRVGVKMMAGDGGSIINISSVAGLEASAGQGIYSVTKAGLIMLTKVMAREMGASGVRVNCICPGVIRTHLSRALWEDEKTAKGYLARKALGRIGEVDELVGAAIYFASEASSFTTGAVLQVDGGMVI